MWRNYLKIAVRGLRRRPGYAVTNIFGLSLGLMCCLLIGIYLTAELSYDRFHDRSGQIYRVVRDRVISGEERRTVAQPFPLGPAMLEDLQGVENMVRLYRTFQQVPLLSHGEQEFYEENLWFADPSVFDIFTLPFVAGSPAGALDQPGTIVLSASMADKYFGSGNPIGQAVTFENTIDFRVTGVMEDLPDESHIPIDFLASMTGIDDVFAATGTNMDWQDSWFWNPCQTYVLLPDGVSPERVEAQIPAMVSKRLGDQPDFADRIYRRVEFQPLTSIHLHSQFDSEIQANSDIRYIYLFGCIGVLILLIACINFMNLATAHATNRAQEVGMRKVVGAQRSQLIGQFLGESLLLSALAGVLALVLAAAALPLFRSLTGSSLSFDYLEEPYILVSLIVGILITGLLAGSYPAMYLSRFRPMRVLKGQLMLGQGSGFRRTLVVSQFAASIILIIGTLVVYQQLDYLQSKRLGFDKEQLVYVPVRGTPVEEQYQTFKAALTQDVHILKASAVSNVLGQEIDNRPVVAEGLPPGEYLHMPGLYADEHFFAMSGVEIIAGRPFSPAFLAADTAFGHVIINETAARRLNWTPEEAIGKLVQFGSELNEEGGVVVGVARDFHFAPLRQTIEPLAIVNEESWFDFVALRIQPEGVPAALEHLERTWASFAPGRPLDYFFVDEHLRTLYASEVQLGTLVGLFTLLAIFIACLGLLGLAAFTAQQRTKEIGVRKVLGASVSGIVLLISSDLLRLLGIAFVIGAPLAYIGTRQWLSNFAYQADVGLGIFLLAGILTLAVALLTVSYHTLRAATADPIRSLRYE